LCGEWNAFGYFWNQVGREHGGLDYADDIRKNSPEVIQKCLVLKEQRCRNSNHLDRFVRYDESTLLELPSPQSGKKYLKSKYPWLLIDIVDIQEIRPNVFCVNDLFIDILVNFDGSYHVLELSGCR
jgi:hypothetical protein